VKSLRNEQGTKSVNNSRAARLSDLCRVGLALTRAPACASRTRLCRAATTPTNMSEAPQKPIRPRINLKQLATRMTTYEFCRESVGLTNDIL